MTPYWGAPDLPVEPLYLDNASITVSLAGSVTIAGAVSFVTATNSPITGSIKLALTLSPFSAIGTISVMGDFPHAISFGLGGGLGFTTRHFTAAGSGTLDALGLDGEGTAVVSDAGAGASGRLCKTLGVSVLGFGASHTFCVSLAVAGTWSQIKNLDLSIIGGDPEKLVTVPGVASAAAANGATVVNVAAGRRLLVVSASSSTGPPVLALTPPHGRTYLTSAPTGALLVVAQPTFNMTTATVLQPAAGRWLVRAVGAHGPLSLQVQTIHSVSLLRAGALSPHTSARHGLRTGRRVTLRWSSHGLPAAARVTLIRGAAAAAATPLHGVVVAGNLPVSGRYRLAAGANHFTLVVELNGTPFQEVAVRGATWRTAARTRLPAARLLQTGSRP